MRAIEVSTGGTPKRLLAVNSGQGAVAVAAVGERWRIEVGWWRLGPERPVRREYWRVLLEDGSCLDLHFDLTSKRWSLERRWG